MLDSTDGFEFFAREDGLFVIHLEAISSAGIRQDFAAWLVDRELLDADSLALVDQSLSLYWRWAGQLRRRSPAYWPPPRAQYLCIVYRPDWVRPYFHVFHKNSWLVYRSDFEATTSSVEFAAFQLFFAERLGLAHEIFPALAANLSYFVFLDDAARANFARGATDSSRPDAAAWRGLAAAADDLAGLHHVNLRPLAVALPFARVDPASGLFVSPSAQALLDRIEVNGARGALEAIDRHVAAHGRPPPDGPERLARWLLETWPMLVMTSADNSIIWDPDRPDETSELCATVQG